jgi:hypothetical protein
VNEGPILGQMALETGVLAHKQRILAIPLTSINACCGLMSS